MKNIPIPNSNCAIRFLDSYVPPSLPGRDEWIAALRSGTMAQGKNTLCRIIHDVASYCCLGVLCKVQNRRMMLYEGLVTFDTSSKGLSLANPMYQSLSTLGTFPKGSRVFNVTDGKYREHLAGLNDDFDLNFEQIAFVIETLWSHAPKNWV